MTRPIWHRKSQLLISMTILKDGELPWITWLIFTWLVILSGHSCLDTMLCSIINISENFCFCLRLVSSWCRMVTMIRLRVCVRDGNRGGASHPMPFSWVLHHGVSTNRCRLFRYCGQLRPTKLGNGLEGLSNDVLILLRNQIIRLQWTTYTKSTWTTGKVNMP